MARHDPRRGLGRAPRRQRPGSSRGAMEHPSQDVDRRGELAAAQAPFAVVFGCSRLARGRGDRLRPRPGRPVRGAHRRARAWTPPCSGRSSTGSRCSAPPLVVVLGHDSCGAVGAAAEALTTGVMPTGFVRAVVDRVIPSIVDAALRPGDAGGRGGVVVPSPEALGREHLRHTVDMLLATRARWPERCATAGAPWSGRSTRSPRAARGRSRRAAPSEPPARTAGPP